MASRPMIDLINVNGYIFWLLKSIKSFLSPCCKTQLSPAAQAGIPQVSDSMPAGHSRHACLITFVLCVDAKSSIELL